MVTEQRDRVAAFLTRWQNSQGNERANAQSFFQDLCETLGVPKPPPKGSFKSDHYCFEKDIKIYHPSGKVTSGFIDFYKEDHFLIEAKQGGTTQKGTAKRGTATYRREMAKAFVQAVSYTRHLPSKPPFLLVCDIGDHFELWWGFNGDYGGYAARTDIPLAHLQKPEIFALFVDIFTNPQARNPEKIAAQVTREVAADLALLTKTLENEHNPEEVALFLMRCIFTMFAEDVGLLKEHLFTDTLATRWLKNPRQFKPQVEALWQAMNDGTDFGFYGKLLRFNGGLFANPVAFDLNVAQIEVLLTAAKRDWQNVEPAIFGTLLERALDKAERKKLGAHYTPRSYVERLVRPVVIEPLREQWELVQGEVIKIIGDAPKPTTAKRNKAVATLEAFLTELRGVRILDPACGTGNFLYVTMDLLKQLETEVLKRIGDITESDQLRLDVDLINPSQFLGIEINPRASAIADLVIWIGYLQWHFRRFGDIPPVEPVLREYHNIENRDAVLAYDGTEPDIDPKTNKVRTRWGGRTMQHPVTGEAVPDPSDQIPILRYLNPRPAEWPEADYVVSNPPFMGKLYMLERLGEGYVRSLRKTYKGKVPDSVDYVMYWWYVAANLTSQKEILKFGFVTTNSITQTFNSRVINAAIYSSQPISLCFVIPDHPWINNEDCAAVRIAMTVATQGKISGELSIVTQEIIKDDGTFKIQLVSNTGLIHANLKIGVDILNAKPLRANFGLAGMG
ncbi:MAG: type IIL restriction-modification enzyme MmeI, partial [Jaaginema sp. PMC 1079.18]|nr:type IIL restriction-modification enzyme MmeI [Jaaginema sp. PMC 1079.18]